MLTISDLQVYYGGIHALKGISFEISQGSIIALLGANGAGKTTTLRTICGLERARSGKILLENSEIGQMDPVRIVKAGITMVPEHRRVLTNLTVRENLLMGAWIRKDHEDIHQDMQRIYKLFPRLNERLKQRAGTLSGGEQQMLAIGRALMSKPKLLLMDEPSLGLAPLLVSQLFQTIKQIHVEQDLTILLVEQNARAALRISDYGYVMETGKIVLQGTAEDLVSDERVQKAYLGA